MKVFHTRTYKTRLTEPVLQALFFVLTCISVSIPERKKTDTGKMKVSHKGMCAVYRNDEGVITVKDGFDSVTIKEFDRENLLVPVFENGRMIKEYSLSEIRNTLHNGDF